jgi:hypothetical protein
VVGIAFLLYTIYRNVHGVPFPYDRFPWVVLAWLVLGGAFILLAPGLARRIGQALVHDAELDEPGVVSD